MQPRAHILGGAMLTEDTARRLASTGRLAGSSMERSLNEVTSVVTRGVRGCAAAAVAVWEDSEIRSIAASHPDISGLLEAQPAWGEGPVLEARRTLQSVFVPDALDDRRWPRFTAAAVHVGVRSLLVLPLEADGFVVTVSLYGARPRTWREKDILPLAALFGTQVAVIARNVGAYESASAGEVRSRWRSVLPSQH